MPENSPIDIGLGLINSNDLAEFITWLGGLDRNSFLEVINSDTIYDALSSLPGSEAALDMFNSMREWANPTRDSTLGQSEYDFTYRIFPSDLGNPSGRSYNGHYMVININVQDTSRMATVSYNGQTSQVFNVLGGEKSKTDALRFEIDNRFTASGAQLGQTYTSRPRFTKRIKESIALYMPNAELTFNDTHDFENISLTKFGASIAAAGAGLVGGFLGGLAGLGAGAAGVATGAGFGQSFVDSATGVISPAAQILGSPVNPKVEVLYANTFQREHRFDFIFSPSTPDESRALQQIIRTLRFHAAPELKPGELSSFFWTPPSEFDITFYNRGTENTKIPRINTCALTQIDVSYSPNGTWSTFYDGYPVQIRMQLAFREVEVTHKLRVLQGF